MKELELYLHIPFCERECAGIVIFLSVPPADLPVRDFLYKEVTGRDCILRGTIWGISG